MPRGQPFTRLCQTLSHPAAAGRADLHLHTTCSDGLYTPAQIVELARRAGLSALAITDHDTLDGIAPAEVCAAGTMEVVVGVEITCSLQGKELHLLGYFFEAGDLPLRSALHQVCLDRHERFLEMVQRLRGVGVHLDAGLIDGLPRNGSLGRRHLAALLIQNRKVADMREAFQRYLGDRGRITVPKRALPVEHALELVHAAGGVASWAHPFYEDSTAKLPVLAEMGLDAVEINFPSCRPGHARELRRLVQELDLAVTGGSDCHGPEPVGRTVGSWGISRAELEILRARVNSLSNCHKMSRDSIGCPAV